MDIDLSNIVKSTAGRDSGRLFFVIAADTEFLYLADGKLRKIERPKSKKMKHAKFIAAANSRIAERIKTGEKVTNSELRRALAEFSGGE